MYIIRRVEHYRSMDIGKRRNTCTFQHKHTVTQNVGQDKNSPAEDNTMSGTLKVNG